MISYIKGNVIIKKERFIVVSVGSIGYQIYLTAQDLEKIRESDELKVYTHTHVREDALELYGFQTWSELEFFSQLIEISGVGPRSALAVMSVAPLEDIKKAVVHGDPAILQQVAGIGKKTAERIIVELKEKVKFTTDFDTDGLMNIGDTQVIEALNSLGYKDKEIRPIITKISPDITDLGERIREALKILGTK